MIEDIALGYALGTLDDAEVASAEELLTTDPRFVTEVQRARDDMSRIREGLELVAGDVDRASLSPPARWGVRALAAAAAAVLAAATILTLTRGATPGTTPQPGPTLAVPVPGAANLDNLVRDAVLIVTGTIVDVRDGKVGQGEGAMPYQIAEIEVDESLKGTAASRVNAFDFTYGTSWVRPGERVLLFLSGSEGTIHESVQPAHYQVLNGDFGSYEVIDGELTGAPFTLEDVRRSIG